jgi:signal transduction histidine kinase
VNVYVRLRSLIRVDDPSPLLKQFPLAVLFLCANIVVGLSDEIEYRMVVASIAAIALLAFATALSALFTLQRSLLNFAIAIPIIDFFALSLFRSGTGGHESPFSSLLVLPMVWVAARPGRWSILIAAAGTAVATTNIVDFSGATDGTTGDSYRSVFAPVVFSIAAAIINELARQGRSQVKSIRVLAEQREVMLRGAAEYTERLKESEAHLRAADELTRRVLDAVTEQSVVGTDVTGLIDVWNPGAERMLGLTAQETQGKRFIYEFHVEKELDDRSRELNYPPGETVLTPGFSALVESARLGIPEVRQWTYQRDDGLKIAVDIAVTRRVDEDGQTVGYLHVATDVTQAIEVARLKDEFVGLISHELRTPLSSILGYLELMRDDEDDPLSEEQLMYLTIAERNAHRLLRLVGDLLFTAQVGANAFTVDAAPIDISAIIATSVESVMPLAAARNITVTADDLAPEIVSGDATRLGQAIDNLLSNAIKFTPIAGRVTVTVSSDSEMVTVRLTDTGMGIPANELNQLFARFFRASTATRAAVQGVGLGLTITKAIIDAHNGQLDVESEVGVGTTFIVRLPKVAVAEPAAIG